MTVYLGTHGTIELQRQSATPFFELELKSDDVDTTKKRFSFHKLQHGDLPRSNLRSPLTGSTLLYPNK